MSSLPKKETTSEGRTTVIFDKYLQKTKFSYK